MALHPQTAASLAAYHTSAPVIDYETMTTTELRSQFSIPKPNIVSDGLQSVEDRTVPGPAAAARWPWL